MQPGSWRRRIVAIALLCGCGLVLDGGAAAAQSTATVRLVGHIPPQATIQLDATGSSTVVSLDLSHPTGTINLLNFTNSANGGESYSVSITSDNVSANGTPQLVAQDGGAAVPFQLVYNGQPLQFSNGVAVLNTIGGSSVSSGNGALGLVPLGQAGNGNYTDTLVFNIVAQ